MLCLTVYVFFCYRSAGPHDSWRCGTTVWVWCCGCSGVRVIVAVIGMLAWLSLIRASWRRSLVTPKHCATILVGWSRGEPIYRSHLAPLRGMHKNPHGVLDLSIVGLCRWKVRPDLPEIGGEQRSGDSYVWASAKLKRWSHAEGRQVLREKQYGCFTRQGLGTMIMK